MWLPTLKSYGNMQKRYGPAFGDVPVEAFANRSRLLRLQRRVFRRECRTGHVCRLSFLHCGGLSSECWNLPSLTSAMRLADARPSRWRRDGARIMLVT